MVYLWRFRSGWVNLLEWLTDLFNVIFRSAKMPREWRTSTMTPCTRTKEIFKIVIIIEVLNYLAIP